MKVIALLLPVVLLGCGSTDHVDLVHDLRLLAAKAEPPNEVLPVVLLPDGGAVLLSFGPIDAGALLAPMQITALVADPDGEGRPIQYQFSVCAQVDSTTHLCLPSSPDYQVLGSGTAVPPDQKSVEIPAQFVPTVQLLADAINLDPYHGIDGLNIPIAISVSAGSGSDGGMDQGVKLVVFSFPSLAALFSSDGGAFALPTPFVNPVLADVAVDGTLWDPTDAGLILNDATLGAQSSSGSKSKITGNSPGGQSAGFQFYPVPAAGGEVSYSLPTFTGGTVELKESWRYHFYGTAGTFSPASSGGFSAAFDVDNPIDSNWTPGTSDPQQDVWFWIVVDNGRGGTDWLKREGQYVP